jgi:autotransporter adhesin
MPRIFLTFDGDMEGEPIINLGAGVGPTDAVNKSQLDAKLNAAEKGQANGVATLDAAGTVPTGQIPPLPYVPTSQKGQANGVATLDAAGKVPASQLDVGPTFDGDMQGTSLINLGAGTAATDAVNKGQMDAQLTAKLNAAEKGQANGVATLDAAGKVPASQLDVDPTFDGDMQGASLVNLGAGTAATDAVNKSQMDAQLAAKLNAAEKGQANGVATLDAGGKVPASQLPTQQSAVGFARRLSAAGSIDLNSTAEQVVDIAHGSAAKPAFAKVVVVDVIQDDPAVDMSAVRWQAGYPVYDEAASTSTHARVLAKFAAGAGIPATGRARIFFEL